MKSSNVPKNLSELKKLDSLKLKKLKKEDEVVSESLVLARPFKLKNLDLLCLKLAETLSSRLLSLSQSPSALELTFFFTPDSPLPSFSVSTAITSADRDLLKTTSRLYPKLISLLFSNPRSAFSLEKYRVKKISLSGKNLEFAPPPSSAQLSLLS